MPHIASIVYTPLGVDERKPRDGYARFAISPVRLVESFGIENDAKGGPGDRQLNVMFTEVLAELGAEGFKAGPGELGEQIVLAGLDPAVLVQGTQLRLGSAIIEVGIPRTGCDRFEKIQCKSRRSAKGRLGVLATVIKGGDIAVGDVVEVIHSSIRADPMKQ